MPQRGHTVGSGQAGEERAGSQTLSHGTVLTPIRRGLILTLCLAGCVFLLIVVATTYLSDPAAHNWFVAAGFIAIAAILALFGYLVFSYHPFAVRQDNVYLIHPITLPPGRRTRNIPIASIADAWSETRDSGKVGLWIAIRNGPRLHVATMVQEDEKEFARRFVDYIHRKKAPS